MRLARRLRSASGVTIIEITVMLAASIALAGALAPTTSAFLRDARITTATLALTNLASAINTALPDIGFAEFKVDGDGKSSGCDDCVVMLVSDGDIPNACTVSVTDGCGVPTPPLTTPNKSWLRPVQPDSNGTTTFTFIDFFDRHLILNLPGNNAANTYVTAWRGAYINTPITSDPWGNRYAFSAQNLNTPQTANIISAGPDEAIDTTWDLAVTTAGKDDITVLVQP